MIRKGYPLSCAVRTLVRVFPGVLVFSLALFFSGATMAQEKKPASRDSGEPKALSGISIMGNNEAPKSLYIVPWKAADIGDNNGLTPGMLDARNAPVDKDVFMREISYHELRSPK